MHSLTNRARRYTVDKDNKPIEVKACTLKQWTFRGIICIAMSCMVCERNFAAFTELKPVVSHSHAQTM